LRASGGKHHRFPARTFGPGWQMAAGAVSWTSHPRETAHPWALQSHATSGYWRLHRNPARKNPPTVPWKRSQPPPAGAARYRVRTRALLRVRPDTAYKHGSSFVVCAEGLVGTIDSCPACQRKCDDHGRGHEEAVVQIRMYPAWKVAVARQYRDGCSFLLLDFGGQWSGI